MSFELQVTCAANAFGQLVKDQMTKRNSRRESRRTTIESTANDNPLATAQRPISPSFLADNTIHCGDSVSLINQLEPSSLALSVWSPPYFVGKNYEKDNTFEDWQALLRQVIAGHASALKPGGFMVINIADILCFKDETLPRIQMPNPGRHKIRLTKEEIEAVAAQHREWGRDELAAHFGVSEQTIDRRRNGNNVRGGKYQAQTRVFLTGDMLVEMAKAAGMYLYDRRIWKKDPAWQNSRWCSLSYRAVDEFEYLYFFLKPGEVMVNRERLMKHEWAEWGSRAVWEFPSVRANNDHEAMFPIELPRRVIRLLSDPGDLVLDPFMGSGTSAEACTQLGRRFIGFERDPRYVELALKRIGHSSNVTSICGRARSTTKAKTTQVTKAAG